MHTVPKTLFAFLWIWNTGTLTIIQTSQNKFNMKCRKKQEHPRGVLNGSFFWDPFANSTLHRDHVTFQLMRFTTIDFWNLQNKPEKPQ
jgi:hypothetical protein